MYRIHKYWCNKVNKGYKIWREHSIFARKMIPKRLGMQYLSCVEQIAPTQMSCSGIDMGIQEVSVAMSRQKYP